MRSIIWMAWSLLIYFAPEKENAKEKGYTHTYILAMWKSLLTIKILSDRNIHMASAHTSNTGTERNVNTKYLACSQNFIQTLEINLKNSKIMFVVKQKGLYFISISWQNVWKWKKINYYAGLLHDFLYKV